MATAGSGSIRGTLDTSAALENACVPLLEPPHPVRNHIYWRIVGNRRNLSGPDGTSVLNDDRLVHRPTPLDEFGGTFSAPAFLLVPSVQGPGLGGAGWFLADPFGMFDHHRGRGPGGPGGRAVDNLVRRVPQGQP